MNTDLPNLQAQLQFGVAEIFVPGERGNKLTKERLASGEIEIEDNLYQELRNYALRE